MNNQGEIATVVHTPCNFSESPTSWLNVQSNLSSPINFQYFTIRNSENVRPFFKVQYDRSKFKVEEVMTSRGLSQENLRDMKALFDLFDIDGDGSISLSELETVMKTLGHCPPKYVIFWSLYRFVDFIRIHQFGF